MGAAQKHEEISPTQPRVQNSAAPAKVSVWVSPAKPVPHTGILLAAGIGIILLLGWGSWVAVRLIVNPGSVSWVAGFVPDWGQFAGMDSAQTLAEVAAEANRQGLKAGQPIALRSHVFKESAIAQDLLLPILAPQSRCQAEGGCWQLIELRAYRPVAPTKFELIDRLSVAGSEELPAIAPLVRAQAANSQEVNQGRRQLPLTDVSLIEGKAPDAAVWLTVSGEWQRGSSKIRQGQVVRYDPQRDRLQPLLAWTSPAGQLPRWQQITGTAIAELVVDQTVGLEPQFQVYQVRFPTAPGMPMVLEAIVLTETVLNQPLYADGLQLARSGLWSLALKLLQQAKPIGWSPAAQAQMDYVALHAQVTQAQALRDWASPTQQIAVLVIDGRWSSALDLLKAAHRNGYDVKNLLVANAASLRQRVEAALRVNPGQLEVQQWVALAVAAQHDRATALQWLQRRSSGKASQILALLDPIAREGAVANLPHPQSAPLRVIGSVVPPAAVRLSDWFSPTPLSLPPQQQWYVVRLLDWQDGQPQSADRAQSAQALWNRLGLAQAPPLHLMVGTNSLPIQASVKAVQWNGGVQLLVAAPAIEIDPAQPAIAFTPTTVQWLAPQDVLTLANLHQQQPQSTTVLLDELQRQLEQAGQALPQAEPVIAGSSVTPSSLDDWRVERLDLTGDRQPESVITLNAETAAAPRTLVFSSEGRLLYSDLSSPTQHIVAIASSQNETPLLIIQSGQTYHIRQWSPQQRFE